MRRLAVIALLCLPAFGQIAHKADSVTDRNGRPAPGATVRVCASTGTGIAGSCVPLVSIYRDKALTIPIVNSTAVADAQGNYDYYVANAGNYRADICYAGTCTIFNDYVAPAGATAPLAWSLAPFTDDGATDGIIGTLSPERSMTLIRARIRGDRPWTSCAAAPTLTVTLPQTPPAADIVAGTLTVQNAVLSGAGSGRDYVLSASGTFAQSVVANSEVIVSWTHGASCTQFPNTVFVTLEFDGSR